MQETTRNLIWDVQYSLRSLLRSKGFFATVFVTLSVCIAVNVAIFAIVNSVLLRPLPFPNANAIVLMSNRYPKAGFGDLNTSSPGDYYERLQKITALQDQAMFQLGNQTIGANEIPEQVMGMAVTPSLFKLLQVGPFLGRPFNTNDGEIGSEQKVILSYGMWQRLFAGDRAILGRTLDLSGRRFEIVGVMPSDFAFINPDVRLWIPLAFTQEQKTLHNVNNWYNLGRIRPGYSIQQVQAQIDSLNAANLQTLPTKQVLIDAGFCTVVSRLQDELVKDVKTALYLLWCGAVFVLLIGGLNVSNLVFARMNLRRKELAMRLALGAKRSQLVAQLTIDNLLLATSSGVTGVVLGAFVLRLLAVVGINAFPRAYEVRISGQVVALGMAMAVVTGVLIGFVSIVSLLRGEFNSILNEDDRTRTGGKGVRLVRRGLVIAQIGFAFSLLVSAGLLLVSFRQLLRVDPGFRIDGIVTASVNAPQSKYRDAVQLQTLMDRSLDAIRRTPGVISAGATTTIPLSGKYDDSPILPEGHVVKPGESLISPRRLWVTPGYLETMGIGLQGGRYFRDSDDRDSPPVVIVDERLAHRFWPNRDPLGERMYQPDLKDPTKADNATVWYRVVGVVKSVRLEDLSGKGNSEGAYYFPYSQNTFRTFTFAIRTVGDGTTLIHSVQTEIAAIDPELALFDIRTMTQRIALSLSSRRTSMLMALAFGALALFLASVGIYGVLAYLVAQRRREIAIRVALGSTQIGIVTLVLREGLVLVGIGLVMGIVGAVSMRTAVANQIYGIGPLDPLVIGGVAILFGAVALAACVVPARRAASVDPAIVLNDQ